MSDASESWWSSTSSYSPAEEYLFDWVDSYPAIGSQPANRAQRFMQNLRAQFKRMKSVILSGALTRGLFYLPGDSDPDIPLRPLSGLLRADTQPSVGETGSDEIVKIMNMVILIPPGANSENLMLDTEDATSSSNNIKFKSGSLAAILLSKKPAIINLNFPKLKEIIESFSTSTCTESEDKESSLDGEADGQSQDSAGNSCYMTEVRAEMRVNKSGRATLSVGSKVFVLALAAKPKISRKVVLVDWQKRQTRLGLINYYIDVLPQEEVETDIIKLQ